MFQYLDTLYLQYFIITAMFQFYFCYEYAINGKIPSFLNMTFNNLEEDIFPKNISVDISFTRHAGTLLYSIDSNNNQLIVTINDMNTATLIIEKNGEKQIFSVPDLCHCYLCRFERLNMIIQVTSKVYLKCNQGVQKSFAYGSTKYLNKNYPTPAFNNTNKLSAYLWLVNTPQYNEVYPNADQLSGCIFEVRYNNALLNMGRHQVKDQCKRTCTKEICNGGTCWETYNTHPICNCTALFNNGPYCNGSLHRQNQNTAQESNYKSIKLSFNTKSDEIFEIFNKRVSVKISVNIPKLILTIKTKDTSANSTFTKVISSEYRKEKNCIVILTFNSNSVDVKFHTESTSWSNSLVPFYYDLSNELFEGLILKSEEGVMDMVYVNNVKELRWIRVLNKSDNNQEIYTSTIKSTMSTNEINLSRNAIVAVIKGKERDNKELALQGRKDPVDIVNNEMQNLKLRVNTIIILVCLQTLILIVVVCMAYFILKRRHHKKYIPVQIMKEESQIGCIQKEEHHVFIDSNHSSNGYSSSNGLLDERLQTCI